MNNDATLVSAKPVASRSLWWRVRRAMARNAALLLMTLPGLTVLFTFAYLPMPGIILAFKDFKAAQGIWGSAWVGFAHVTMRKTGVS